MNMKELNYTELKNTCDPYKLGFKTTKELECYNGIIGQERAVKAFTLRVLPVREKRRMQNRVRRKKQRMKKFRMTGVMYIILMTRDVRFH